MSTERTTLADLGQQAKAEVQRLLDEAREGAARLEGALAEAAGTPLFGNGLATAMKDVRTEASRMDAQLVALKQAVEQYGRREVPDATKDRAAAMRGES